MEGQNYSRPGQAGSGSRWDGELVMSGKTWQECAMRWPRLRFTVRRMMVAIAVVAIYLGWSRWMERRSERFRALWIAYINKVGPISSLIRAMRRTGVWLTPRVAVAAVLAMCGWLVWIIIMPAPTDRIVVPAAISKSAEVGFVHSSPPPWPKVNCFALSSRD
jgi:hypothetical protein